MSPKLVTFMLGCDSHFEHSIVCFHFEGVEGLKCEYSMLFQRLVCSISCNAHKYSTIRISDLGVHLDQVIILGDQVVVIKKL